MEQCFQRFHAGEDVRPVTSALASFYHLFQVYYKVRQLFYYKVRRLLKRATLQCIFQTGNFVSAFTRNQAFFRQSIMQFVNLIQLSWTLLRLKQIISRKVITKCFRASQTCLVAFKINSYCYNERFWQLYISVLYNERKSRKDRSSTFIYYMLYSVNSSVRLPVHKNIAKYLTISKNNIILILTTNETQLIPARKLQLLMLINMFPQKRELH